jgi:hypothetical protein
MPTTTLSTASKSNAVVDLGSSTNAGITGSVTCQNIVSGGSSLTILNMAPPYSGMLKNPTTTGTTAIKSNGSDFDVFYEEP